MRRALTWHAVKAILGACTKTAGSHGGGDSAVLGLARLNGLWCTERGVGSQYSGSLGRQECALKKSICGVTSATNERLFLTLIDRFLTFNAQSTAKVISGEPHS